MGGGDFVMETLVPAAGALIAIAMYASPMRAVLKAHERGTLGDLNPIPMAVGTINTVAWISYGFLKLDPMITAPNIVGLPFGLYGTLIAYGLAEEEVRAKLRQLLMFSVCVLVLFGTYTTFMVSLVAAKLSVWGTTANVITLLYYGAPLSSMAEVVRTRNSSSILLPLTIMSATNAALWTVYGVAIMDVYVYLPNGIGLMLALAQFALRMIYPPSGPRS